MKRVRQRLSRLMGAIALTGGLLSCGNLAQRIESSSPVDFTASKATPISQILSQVHASRSRGISPGEATATQAQLRGQVVEVAPLLEGGAYRLQDNSGSIWVLTTAPLPQVGDTLHIQGEARYQPIVIAGQDLGEAYLMEIGRR
ncbi:hypothetical protein OOK60_18200 [Trichothermofontia sichuanensis B231]|uniref:hypothetical protein n=1 Tax=Trichothermofontia sichuanensis TaxID=3045816 RepID=UPI0022467935|nr:hypothetical protein [Trichothermofontia sichuanensis]UZQ54377.1 hypothetical protein OOK60_18200 [Trichothermofontia sichuanensis B231]